MNASSLLIAGVLFFVAGVVGISRGWWNVGYGRHDWHGWLALLGGILAVACGTGLILSWFEGLMH